MTTENKPSQPPQNIKLPWKVIKEKGQVCPDGVVIGINWDDFVVGASIFIPAINLAELVNTFQTFAQGCKTLIGSIDCDTVRDRFQPAISYSLNPDKGADYTVTNIDYRADGTTALVWEKAYEKLLRGEWGGQQVEVDGSGRPLRVLGRNKLKLVMIYI